jgi:hypothetical protein
MKEERDVIVMWWCLQNKWLLSNKKGCSCATLFVALPCHQRLSVFKHQSVAIGTDWLSMEMTSPL